MQDKISMYSEEVYINRMQLKNIYASMIADLMYEEIIKYRALFKYPLSFHARPFYITMNQTLYKKMLRIYELQVFEIIETSRFDFMNYLNTYKNKTNIVNDFFTFFLYSNEDILIKTYIIYAFIKDESFLYQFLLWNNKTFWYSYILKIQIQQDESDEPLDLTYGFRFFLDNFFQLLKEDIDQSIIYESEKDLFLKYPFIKERNIEFYILHSIQNKKYAISVYQTYFKVSYECARLAMEKMYHYNWYKKIKIGKKHYYIPNLIVKSEKA